MNQENFLFNKKFKIDISGEEIEVARIQYRRRDGKPYIYLNETANSHESIPSYLLEEFKKWLDDAQQYIWRWTAATKHLTEKE